jgi:hypothetical protein
MSNVLKAHVTRSRGDFETEIILSNRMWECRDSKGLFAYIDMLIGAVNKAHYLCGVIETSTSKIADILVVDFVCGSAHRLTLLPGHYRCRALV